jgi:hypothetical protein
MMDADGFFLTAVVQRLESGNKRKIAITKIKHVDRSKLSEAPNLIRIEKLSLMSGPKG